MQDTYTLAVDFNLREYIQLSSVLLPRLKPIRRVFLFLICFGIIVGLLGAPGKNEKIGISTLLHFFIAPLVLLMLFVIGIVVSAIYVDRWKPQSIRGITYRFTHWGMEVRTADKEADIPWRDFQQVKETKAYFLLYVKEKNHDNVHVIQKRKFADSHEAAGFKAFVMRNLPIFAG